MIAIRYEILANRGNVLLMGEEKTETQKKEKSSYFLTIKIKNKPY